MFLLLNFYLSQLVSSFVKVIQQLKLQKQHSKTMLKILKKRTLFSQGRIFKADTVYQKIYV